MAAGIRKDETTHVMLYFINYVDNVILNLIYYDGIIIFS